jgi:hypothetical protein
MVPTGKPLVLHSEHVEGEANTASVVSKRAFCRGQLCKTTLQGRRASRS